MDSPDPRANHPLIFTALATDGRPALRYGFAVFSVGLACLTNWALWPFMQGAFFMLYLAAVIFTGLFGGWKPGLLAIGLSLVKITYFHLDPLFSFRIGNVNDRVRLAIYVALSCLVLWVCESLRGAYTQLQTAFRESEYLHRRYRDTLSVISHDLRNPLSAILLNATILKRRSSAPDSGASGVAIEKHAELIRNSGDRMNRMIEDLLRLARIEAGTLQLQPESVDYDHLLQAAVGPFHSLAEAHRIRLRSVNRSPGDTLDVDPDILRRAIANLVENACRFTPDGGEITVTARTRGGATAEFEVRDTGPGIAAERLPLLFDRYWQAAHAAPGKGLGLLVAQGIVDAHGGHLSAESRLGEGSRFTISLPRSQAAAWPRLVRSA